MRKSRSSARPPTTPVVRRDSTPPTSGKPGGKVVTLPPQANRLFQQGNDCYDRAAFAEAITYYQQAIQVAPRESVIHCNLGSAYWAMG
ncbi:MAG: tetratricopeptide repeat protein, partial [Magnetococcales bacterium]|nr:tetratricopeptide repeat protein [Magnetococcales bacterium]